MENTDGDWSAVLDWPEWLLALIGIIVFLGLWVASLFSTRAREILNHPNLESFRPIP